MQKQVAGCVLAIWLVVAGSLVTACGQSGAVKQAVSSYTVKSTAAATHATAPAAASTPAHASTAAPERSSATSGWLWLWIALAVLVVAILTAWFIRKRHRRGAIAANWQKRLIDAYAKGSALVDAMAVAETPEASGAPDASPRWTDIQRRADDFGQLLYSLRESAHDDQERIAIDVVLASLRSVLSAMAAERSAGGTNEAMAVVTRDRLSFFEMSLRSLRGPRARPATRTGDSTGTGDAEPIWRPET